MKRNFLFIIAFMAASIAYGQHCPWDCSGMIMIQTDIPKEKLYLLHPVLVDDNEKEVIDTIYGTGLNTYEQCEFLSYEDFTDYRTKKIAVHHWYQYDTFYNFAAGRYVVKYNKCKYNRKKLYLRFQDPNSRGIDFHYIEIPDSNRIHLHDYSRELWARETSKLKKLTEPFVLKISCKEWNVRKEECN